MPVKCDLKRKRERETESETETKRENRTIPKKLYMSFIFSKSKIPN